MVDTCRIQWVDENGRTTPDQNPMVGFAWTVERDEVIEGRKIHTSSSVRFPICAEHAKEISEPGMEHWRFEEWPSKQMIEDAEAELRRPR